MNRKAFQNCSKDYIAQPTVSRVLSDVIETMAKLTPDFIFMPRNNNEICDKKGDFYNIAGFPRVIGYIDESHIPIIASNQNEIAYVNRKISLHQHPRNLRCKPPIFLDVVAKWPESSHYFFILKTSQVNDNFKNGKYADSWLLGDSGFPLEDWVMTSITQPATSTERNFNKVHLKTRCLIEKVFGVLKSRRRILNHTGESMCYSPRKVA